MKVSIVEHCITCNAKMFSKVIDYTISVSISHIISCTLLELDAIQGELSSIAMYIA